MAGRVHGGGLRALLASRGGNVAIIAAAALPILVGALALGVDWGYLGYQKRALQGDTDLAALSAAASLASPQPALRHYLTDNALDFALAGEDGAPGGGSKGRQRNIMTYALGNYAADAALAPSQRFTPGGTPVNAVRVRMRRPADLAFARLFTSPPVIATEAVASTHGIAAFSIGSRLVELKGGILNAVLGKLLGTELNLSAMDYQSLLDTDVDVLSFLDVASTRLHLTADDYEKVLQSQLSVGRFIAILADTQGLSAHVQGLLRQIAGRANDETSLALGKLFDLGALAALHPDAKPPLSARASVLDILSAAATIADGQHQIDLAIDSGLPGIAKLKVSLLVGEPPAGSSWFAVGDTGTVVHTAQTRLKIDASIGGLGGLGGSLIDLPIYVEVANARAAITGITCLGPNPDDGTVDVSARPGVVEAWVGKVPDDALADLDATRPLDPARLVDLKLLGIHIDASAHAAMTDPEAETLHFSEAEIQAGAIQTVSTHSFASSLVSTLIGNLDVQIHVGGLGLGGGLLGLQQALAATLSSVTQPLDTALYNILLGLGIQVGQADVRVTGVDCARPVLVQ